MGHDGQVGLVQRACRHLASAPAYRVPSSVCELGREVPHDHPPSRCEHPRNLTNRGASVADMTHHRRTQQSGEHTVRKRQSLGGGEYEVGSLQPGAQLFGPLQHPRTCINPDGHRSGARRTTNRRTSAAAHVEEHVVGVRLERMKRLALVATDDARQLVPLVLGGPPAKPASPRAHQGRVLGHRNTPASSARSGRDAESNWAARHISHVRVRSNLSQILQASGRIGYPCQHPYFFALGLARAHRLPG
jgi:hypothetical protein